MISDILKRIFYPDDYACIACSRRGKHRPEHCDAVLCDECLAGIQKVDGNICIKCGRRVGSENSYCEMCAKHDFAFDKAASVYCYEDTMRQLAHRFKYSGAQWLRVFGGRAMAQKYSELGWNCDIICYVPMYKTKERARGYNQAQLLAKELSKTADAEYMDLLKRVKNTVPQSKLGKDERMENIANAIELAHGFDEHIKDKAILVADDILTTGSSINECAKVLKAHGARVVYGLCLCSVSEYKNEDAEENII